LGLKYWKDFQTRIPRKEMLLHEDLLKRVISSVDPKLKFQVTGSFRRLEPSSGDIDVLITHSDDPANADELFKSIVEIFKNDGYIINVFAEGGKKCLAICKLKRHKMYRRIDLLYTNKKEYPFAVLYFTGNAEFNVAMRSYCLSKGLSLSEHGLKVEQTGEFVNFNFHSEEDIFKYLGLKFIEPQDRKASSVIEL
jgi:DNA polymerase/3'-5' exonuclease PolX